MRSIPFSLLVVDPDPPAWRARPGIADVLVGYS
jgi:hypothetical protein